MVDKPKISTGPNARPRGETIASTGAGIPDEAAGPADVSERRKEKEEARPADHPKEAPAHQLQQEPAEGSRDVVEQELERQKGNKSP
ncbi:hypothetical protein NYQ83_03305 [Afifella sp. JA880]|uniref:hypothetical protein n=1 Tax=Afifella sp. JA880 TaxID=2975280 RepID=UPI0021BAE669|nr:hypothetical protein [Afifella sp. JA880]MCT8266289.1 hypothetical protein [Afifella sp. JA880]